MNSSPGAPFCVWLMSMNLPPESTSVRRIVRPWLVPPARASETPPIAAAIRPATHAVSTRRPTVVLNIFMELSHLIRVKHAALAVCLDRRICQGGRAHTRAQAGDTLRRLPARMRSSSASPCASIRSSTMAQMASGESVPAALGSSSAA